MTEPLAVPLPYGTVTHDLAGVYADGPDVDPNPDLEALAGVTVELAPMINLGQGEVPLQVIVWNEDPDDLRTYVPEPVQGVYDETTGLLHLKRRDGTTDPADGLRLLVTSHEYMVPSGWYWRATWTRPGKLSGTFLPAARFTLDPGDPVDLGSPLINTATPPPVPIWYENVVQAAGDLTAAIEGAGTTATDAAAAAQDSATAAQGSASTAEAARDATLAASVITGPGRPDVPATLDPAQATLVAAAQPGTVFRSTNAPQGAYEWQRVAASWIVISGRYEWNLGPAELINGWTHSGTAPRLIRLPYEVHLVLPSAGSSLSGESATSNSFLDLPVGWRPDTGGNYGTLGLVMQGSSDLTTPINKQINQISCAYRGRPQGLISWPTAPAWPTT